MKVGFVVHSRRPRSVEAAAAAATRLTGRGVDVVALREDGDPDLGTLPGVTFVAPGEFPHGLDVALSVGGDGTFLRAAHLCRDAGVPVLGLNLGRLGFLAEVDAEDVPRVLDAVAEGEFVVEERGTLEMWAESSTGERLAAGWALNDVSVEKTARQRVLLMALHVGNRLFARVPADAVVVASPTGSTAYAFSAGGPILSPRVRATIVTPVAPHSVFSRSLVVAGDEVVRVEILPDQAPAVVSCDGRPPVTVPSGGSVWAVGGGRPVRLARVGQRNFYSVVREKFGLR